MNAKINSIPNTKIKSVMSNEESEKLYNEVMANPEFYYLLHKNAVTHSLPAFLIVFFIIFSVAKKGKKNKQLIS